MKKELKKITDLTVNELLNQEVILPSIYFEKFNKNALEVEINIDDENFEKDIHTLIKEEYITIEEYMNSISSNVLMIKDTAKDAKDALLDKNIDKLSSIYKKMTNLEKEIESLNNKLFLDETTNIYNRKWIYNKFLGTTGELKEEGIVVFVQLEDYDYIKKEYGELIGNNILQFSVKFMQKKLINENIKFSMARFFEDKILIFCDQEELDYVNSTVLNINQMLANATLKNNSGLLIKTSYNFVIEPYFKKQDSKELFEKLFYKLKQQ